ncbi:MAG: DUF499 domain-containing protein [Chloroflexi bacterium]|nr:DUF499 domain-containing protein [Chloroflexota bacterium]
MLNLELRDEFLGSQMPGTAIALRKKDNTGAAQQDPNFILSITYPTADVQTGLRAVSTNRAKRPIVLLGDRGLGKSHIMAVMHHAVESPGRVQKWANDWGRMLPSQSLSELALEGGFAAISEPVHNQEYPLLWDLIFERHPKGDFFKGKFKQMARPYPPRSLLEEMFEAQPVALILDEFQKWFDGLSDHPGAEGIKYRTLAENFVQNLSELSKDRPDILILVVSVLNNNTEAFRQIHRDGPVIIDFRGPTAKQDRKKLLLYRLFKNREYIPTDEIRGIVNSYASERFRLRFSHLPETDRSRVVSEVAACWPFSPELMELLEDNILMAGAAQETRDLIRILASSYRGRGEAVPVITPADFFVDDDTCGVQSLLDSIATVGEQEKLRQVAHRNLEMVKMVGAGMPHARELISALWIRSMSPGRNTGGTRHELHLDITRAQAVDDNLFQGELVQLIETSINIHGEENADGRLRFGLDENPRSKIRATAKNEKLWKPGVSAADMGQTVYSGKDVEHVRNTLRHILIPETRQSSSQVIALGPNWRSNPWVDVLDSDKPEKWGSPVLIVIPEPLQTLDGKHVDALGKWLASHVSSRRNTVRFLLPAEGDKGIYCDKELIFNSRCSYLTSIAWHDDSKYRGLKEEFDKPLRDALKKRFNKFAVLRRWNYQQPDQCVFDMERVTAQGGDIPTEVEKTLVEALFDPSEFQSLVLERAKESYLIGDLLDELTEPPPPNTKDAIPFLGDREIYEQVLKIVAQGKIVVNVDGTWVGRLAEHSNDEEALRLVRSKAFRSGREMRQIQLGLPAAVGGTTVKGPGPQPSVVPSQPPTGSGAQPGVTAQVPLPVPPVSPAAGRTEARRTDEATTGINLSACFEKWGVDPSVSFH